MIRTETLRLDPADVERVRAAFSGGGLVDAGGGRTVATVGDRVILSEGEDAEEVAKPSRDGAPGRPSISDDGKRLAYVRLDPQGGDSRMEVTNAATGFLGGLRRLASSSLVSTMHSITGVDLAPDGNMIAYVTSNGAVHANATLNGQGKSYYDELPLVEGVRLGAEDVEFLPNGQLAVQTTGGTYLLVDLEGHCTQISREAFDPVGFKERHAAFRERLPGLTDTEARWALDTFGDAMVGAYPSDDASAVLVQIKRDRDRVENIVMDRRGGERVSIGASAEAPVTWTKGLVAVEGGPSGHLRTLFKGWDRDLGQDDLHRRRQEIGEVVHEDEHVVVNGVRVPKRPEA